jgi:pimeloyl-ACP methyl ester carboxylesterase
MTRWILLRGLTRESRHWGRFPQVLASALPGAEIIALDLPGNGTLHTQTSPTSVAAMAAHCRSELARRALAPPYYVLALSLGAMVAAEWAALHPEELQGCVLINTSMRPFGAFYQRLRPSAYGALLRAAWLASAHGAEETILRLSSRGIDADGNATAAVLEDWVAYRRTHPVSRANALRQLWAAARYRAALGAPARGASAGGAPPTTGAHAAKPAPRMLVLVSTRDALVDPRCSRELARAWGAAYAEHPHAGHDLPLDDAPWVAAQVGRWLSSSAAGASADVSRVACSD